ncbi:MAG: hypothetical protein JNJ98_17795 [Gemmatimonadetes bacterium]|nr:hypothetical protein [Gemmatimonadota bacterium]
MYLPYTFPTRQLHRHAVAAVALVAQVAWAQAATAQEPALGLRGIGAFGLTAGASSIERNATGIELGATLDLGHFRSRRVRPGAAVSFLRSLPRSEYVPQEDATYRDVFYDLSGHVTLTVLARDPVHAVVPYASVGAGVHALTSSYGSIPIDIRYNTNVLGLRMGAGLRFRGRARALSLESTAILARNVSRATIGLSTEWLKGDLRRSRDP